MNSTNTTDRYLHLSNEEGAWKKLAWKHLQAKRAATEAEHTASTDEQAFTARREEYWEAEASQIAISLARDAWRERQRTPSPLAELIRFVGDDPPTLAEMIAEGGPR